MRVVKSGSVEAAERAKQAEADGRRKSAEAEAAAIRAMMAAPKKVLTAKKPEDGQARRSGQGRHQGHDPQAQGRPWRCDGGAWHGQAWRQEVGQVREAVVQLGRRRRQEARPQDSRRQRRRARRLAFAARRAQGRPQRRFAGVHRAGGVRDAGSAHPRDHQRGRSGAQDERQGQRGDQAADEARPDGHHQPAARPGDRDDRGRGDGPQGAGRQARRPRGVHRGRNRRPEPASRRRARRWSP